MPSPQAIVESLAAIAHETWVLAAIWHAILLAVLVGLCAGWRPRQRALATGLTVAPLPVAALTRTHGNPLNAGVFIAATVLAGYLVPRLAPDRVDLGPRWAQIAGGLMVAFGFAYPHFTDFGLPLAWLYASPLGLVPCPTLSAAIGLSLLVDSFGSRAWGLTFGIAGLLYGVFGAARLGVHIDAVVIVGAAALLVHAIQVKDATATDG